eukprot:3453992-Amphidinium_carterae.1
MQPRLGCMTFGGKDSLDDHSAGDNFDDDDELPGGLPAKAALATVAKTFKPSVSPPSMRLTPSNANLSGVDSGDEDELKEDGIAAVSENEHMSDSFSYCESEWEYDSDESLSLLSADAKQFIAACADQSSELDHYSNRCSALYEKASDFFVAHAEIHGAQLRYLHMLDPKFCVHD